MRVPSRYLLALILIVLILSQEKRGGGGFFVKFKQALDSAVTRTAVEPRGTQTIIPPNSTVRKSDIGGGFSLPTIGDLENALNGAR